MMKNLDSSDKHLIKNPSNVFKSFVEQYFDVPMCWARNDYDPSLPGRLEGQELEVAKQMVVKNIDTGRSHILVLARKFDLKEVIPKVKDIIGDDLSLDNDKLYLINELYEWIQYPEYEKYIGLMYKVMRGKSEFYKSSVLTWITYTKHFKSDDSRRLLDIALRDADYSVRASALKAFVEFYKINADFSNRYLPVDYFQTQYYVGTDVYDDQIVYESRLGELFEAIKIKQIWTSKQIRSWIARGYGMEKTFEALIKKWRLELKELNSLLGYGEMPPLVRTRFDIIADEIVQYYQKLDDDLDRQTIRDLIRSMEVVHRRFGIPDRLIRTQADEGLLIKALVMISITGMHPDSRDVIINVDYLKRAAIKAGIDSDPIFESIALISSDVNEQGMGSMRDILKSPLR